MGKKNRFKAKKPKSKNSMPSKLLIDKEDNEDPFISIKLQSNKEDFLLHLKQYSSKLLNEFKLYTKARTQSKANVTFRFNPSKIPQDFLTLDTCSDQTNETIEIYSKVFKYFTKCLMDRVQKTEFSQPDKLKITIQDALKLIEMFIQEVSSQSVNLFGINETAFKGFSINLVKEQSKSYLNYEDLIKSLGFWQSYEHESKVWNKFVLSNEVRNGGLASDFDLIVQNFQRKLDIQVGTGDKEKPALSDEWILCIKKLLKSPRTDLGYV